MNYGFSSIKTDSKEGEDARGYREVGDKVVDSAVEGSKFPDSEIFGIR